MTAGVLEVVHMSGSISSIVFGLAVVAVGLVLLLNNLGVTGIDVGTLVGRYWPVILVAMGLSSLVGRRGARDDGDGDDDRSSGDAGNGDRVEMRSRGSNVNIGGWAVLLIGLMLLSGTAGWYRFNWARFWGVAWALLLMAIGWAILRGRPFDGGDAEGEYGTSRWVVMSGLELKQLGWELTSGSYVVLMGSAELDLRAAQISEGTTYLDLTALMGGVEIRVPDGLAVECEGSAILGGVEFFRQSAGGIVSGRTFVRTGEPGSSRLVKIKCRAVMGAVG